MKIATRNIGETEMVQILKIADGRFVVIKNDHPDLEVRSQANPESVKELDDIYLWIGKNLSAWSGLETHLAQLFFFFIKSSDRDISFTTFAAIGGFSTKRRVLNQSSIQFFNELKKQNGEQEKVLRTTWNKIDKKIHGLIDNRNNMAHWDACIFFDDPAPNGDQKKSKLTRRAKQAKLGNTQLDRAFAQSNLCLLRC